MFGLSERILGRLITSRYQPRTSVEAIVGSLLTAAMCRSGSLNALEQTSRWRVWKRIVGGQLPSAETFARTYAHLELDGLRDGLKHLYQRLKRTKAIKRRRGLKVAVIDGHETNCSEKSRCPLCLERTITIKDQPVVQYYHRLTTLMLITDDINILLDAELQLPGEDEVGCATRLLTRALTAFPRAFELLLCDALYARVGFIGLLRERNKHILAVLKKNRNDLLEDAEGIFSRQPPQAIDQNNKHSLVWDEENFQVDGLDVGLRVVKSLETTTVKRRLKQDEPHTSAWMWLSTMGKQRLPTRSFVELGHDRWLIENNCFKEMAHLWQGDHVYHHHPTAIIAFWLTIMLAYNIVHTFFRFNLKPAVRARRTFLSITDQIKAGLYHANGVVEPPP